MAASDTFAPRESVRFSRIIVAIVLVAGKIPAQVQQGPLTHLVANPFRSDKTEGIIGLPCCRCAGFGLSNEQG